MTTDRVLNIIGPLSLLSLAIGLALPAGALAATASMTTVITQGDDGKGGSFTTTSATITYAAAAGEVNAPVLTVSADGLVVTFTEPSVALTPGEGCSAPSAGQVRCAAPAGAFVGLDVGLGDGDDVLAGFDSPRLQPDVDAGPGADVVDLFSGTAAGGDGDDVLRGATEHVRLSGDAGADVIAGGPGNDSIAGGAGRDRLDGAGGVDSVDWAGETRPVTVDLARPGPAGTAAEPDDVRNFESAGGGRGNDVLRGSAGANRLDGGPGDDLLDAGEGADGLDGGVGADRLLGGNGDDELTNGYVAGGARDTLEGQAGDDLLRNLASGSVMRGGAGDDTLDIEAGARLADGGSGDDRLDGFEVQGSSAFLRCGPGRDRVSGVYGDALIPRDCETVVLLEPGAIGGPSVSSRLTLRGSLLRVALPFLCVGARRCPMRVAVHAGSGRAVARGRRTLLLAGGQGVTIRLGARARRQILRAGRVRLDFSSRDAPRPFPISVRVAR